jgi:predicted DsbA family dithiol-disulfide isomerase
MKIELVSDVACPWSAVGLHSLERALKHALLQAYHGEGRNPGAREVLLELVAAVGLDPARAAQILDGDEFIPEVRAAEGLWLESGIDSVPAVVVNRRQLIQGAQTPEVFAQALRDIAARA